MGLMPKAGRLTCNENAWVQFPQTPPFGFSDYFRYVCKKVAIMISYKKLLGEPTTLPLGRAKNVALGFMVCLLWVSLVVTFLRQMPRQFSISQAGFTFFFTCLLAPLWEELAFRHGPLQIAKKAGEEYVLPLVVISSAWFGWMHGNGSVSILIQGVTGFIIAMVYIKNGFHYWSGVFLHFLWNFFLAFIVPVYV